MNEEIQENRWLKFRSILLVLLLVTGIGVIALLQIRDSSFKLSEIPGFEKGVSAPNFNLPDLNGNMVSLTDFKGKVVLLNVWATWCLPCVEEMPSMEKLYQKLKDEGLVILSVSIDEKGAEVVRPFMKNHKLSFPALTDAEGKTKTLYQITGVPESFIIDKDGSIVEKIIGPRDWATSGAINYFRNLIHKS